MRRIEKAVLPDGDTRALQAAEQDDPASEVFYEALGSDYFDVAARGTASSGIHMGAMAGTVDIVQRCYTGIVMKDDILWLDPMLPKALIRLSFSVRYRGSRSNSTSITIAYKCMRTTRAPARSKSDITTRFMI